MGTVNLLSEFLDGQPLFANNFQNQRKFARSILLLLDFAKYLYELQEKTFNG
jgi:hypothetical protein